MYRATHKRRQEDAAVRWGGCSGERVRRESRCHERRNPRVKRTMRFATAVLPWFVKFS